MEVLAWVVRRLKFTFRGDCYKAKKESKEIIVLRFMCFGLCKKSLIVILVQASADRKTWIVFI